MIVKLCFIILFVLILLREYSKIKVLSKAKILHLLLVILLLVLTLHHPANLGRLLNNYDSERSRITEHLNEFDSRVAVFNQIYSGFIGLLILFFCSGLIILNDVARRIIRKLLLFMIPSVAMYIYIGAKSSGGNFGIIYLIVGFLASGVFFLFISSLFNSKIIIDLFRAKQ